MKIIAQRGKSTYLVVDDDVSDEPKLGSEGRVLDAENDVLHPPLDIQAILSRGYWSEYTGSQSILEELLNEAEAIETPEREQRETGSLGRFRDE